MSPNTESAHLSGNIRKGKEAQVESIRGSLREGVSERPSYEIVLPDGEVIGRVKKLRRKIGVSPARRGSAREPLTR